MVRLLLSIVIVITLGGCGAPVLSQSDWGRPAAATKLRRLAVVAMPSPRLDKPLEGNLVPTAYLARVAADYLKERVEVVDTSQACADSATTWGGIGGWTSMEQYLGHARAWYAEPRSQIDYSDLKKRGVDGVVEIGILNYETFFKTLLMQVIVKLVDPATGAVLGKARSAGNEKIEPFTAEQFKLVFAQMASTLTADNLARIGLATPGGTVGQ